MGALEQRVERAVRAVVPPQAVVQCETVTPPLVQINVNGHSLAACWLGEGRPVQVQEALRQLSPKRPQILIARHMSAKAQALAREAGIGWVDEAGGAEVALDWLVISRSSLNRPDPRCPPGWTSSFCGVAEALLLGAKPTVDAISKTTGLSLDTCRRALNFFVDRNLLAATARRGPRSARHLVEAARLLEEYTEAVTAMPRTELQAGILWRDPMSVIAQLGSRWDDLGIRWAGTSVVAVEVQAPLLTEIGTAEIFVAGETLGDLRYAAESVGAKPMEGGRLVLRTFPSVATDHLSTRKGDFRIAPWPRVYADLIHYGVRGEDAADHLREMMGAQGR